MVENSSIGSVLPPTGSPVAKRRRAWREFKDRVARYGVAMGGVSVIFAIVLIFFYLLYVVLPLFYGAEVDTKSEYQYSANSASYLALNEYNDVALSVDMSGQVTFFAADTGKEILTPQLSLPEGSAITSFSSGDATTGILSYGFDNGQVLLFKREYKISYPDDKRKITPFISYPLGQESIQVDPKGRRVSLLSVQSNDEQSSFAALTENNSLVLQSTIREQDFLDEDAFTLTTQIGEIDLSEFGDITHMEMDIDQRELYIVNRKGFIAYYDIQNIEQARLIQQIKAVPHGVDITTLEFLTGGISILVGRSDGQIDQWFPVRGEDNNTILHNVRSFKEQSAAIIQIEPEYARKGFIALDQTGNFGIYHTTAHRTLLVEPLVDHANVKMALSPRANGLLSLAIDGKAKLIDIVMNTQKSHGIHYGKRSGMKAVISQSIYGNRLRLVMTLSLNLA